VLMGEALPKDWKSDMDLKKYVSRRLVITKPEINGKTFGQLHFSSVYGVNVTRIIRNGIELFANRNLRLQVGDRILVTGTEENIEHVKNVIGASTKKLDHPNVGAIFFGIMVGIIVGQIPIPIPGVEIPVKLGLAGGPLVVAILIGAFGYRYKINTYTSTSANLMLREVGLILFLASVGIQAGATFWNTVTNGDGITYVWAGFLITTIPILIIGVIGRLKLKLNYFTLMGLIAGSNTDPPALAFATQTAGNDAPAVGYSTVYPLAMFLRILMAQLVLLLFM
ncbi:MAG: transporter, partial [Bacteroidaceae bacterium]|nr:transporter [Bacteroidaceae bacterium]